MKFPRRSGVLLHPTSLPGHFGIGDLGEYAIRFVDWLANARQTYWQVLPLSPTGYGDSPYQGLSAFALNPFLFDPRKLVAPKHLAASDLDYTPSLNTCVDFGAVIAFKTRLFEKAFAGFRSLPKKEQGGFDEFCERQAEWLDDFCLFMALKEANGLRPWYEWDEELRGREATALAQARARLADRVTSHKYRQWQLFEQWLALKQYANQKGIRIIGDIPLYVAEDSADVWAYTRLFHTDAHLRPTIVSGVPPDYFSQTGQLWGHPIYRWDLMKQDGYAWWIKRFRMAFTQADVVRIDHFRGFHNYWAVPAGEKTAVRGEWRVGPGADLFRKVSAALGGMAIIAEDLGDFDPPSRAGVDALQAEFDYPGMKVLQFAFGDGSNDPFLPHNFTQKWVVYTGTHDNDTTVGWYETSSTEKERDYARQYVGRDGSDIAWDLIRLGWQSVANTAIAPAQDLLGLGHWARMNTPSTVGPPNWCWRLAENSLDEGIGERLGALSRIYGRAT